MDEPTLYVPALLLIALLAYVYWRMRRQPPTATATAQLERVLRTSPHAYWPQGGNGEVILDAGPGQASLWIKQPEPERFFVTFSKPPVGWLVPYDGGSCASLVRDERGGDPFWISRACLVSVDQAVEIVSCFLLLAVVAILTTGRRSEAPFGHLKTEILWQLLVQCICFPFCTSPPLHPPQPNQRSYEGYQGY